MDVVTLAERRRFRPEKMQKIPLFDSDRFFLDQYCLLPGQAQRVHTHAGEDKVYIVLEGSARVEIDGEQRSLTPGQAVLARAGAAHGVRNDGPDPAVLLVLMAPRPGRNG